MWKNRPIEMSNHTLLSLLTEGHAVSYCLPTKKVQDGLLHFLKPHGYAITQRREQRFVKGSIQTKEAICVKQFLHFS
jgi:hypothetical protein